MEITSKGLWRPWTTLSIMNYDHTASNLNEAINTSCNVGLSKTQVKGISCSGNKRSMYSSHTSDVSLFNWPDKSSGQCSTSNLNEAINTSCNVGLSKTQVKGISCSGNKRSVYSSNTSDVSLFNWPDKSSGQCSTSNSNEAINTSCNVGLPKTQVTAYSICSGNKHSGNPWPTPDLSLVNWPDKSSKCSTLNAPLSPRTNTSDSQCPSPIKRQRSSQLNNNNLSPTLTGNVTKTFSNNLSLISTTNADLPATTNNVSTNLTETFNNNFNWSTTSTFNANQTKPFSSNSSAISDLTAITSNNLSTTSSADETKRFWKNVSAIPEALVTMITSNVCTTSTTSSNVCTTSSANQTDDLSNFTSWLESKLQQISEVNELSTNLEASSNDCDDVSPYGPREFKMKISLSEMDLPMPNAEWIYCDENGLELALNPNTSLLFEHLYKTSSELNSTVQMILPETGREYDICLKGMVMTDVNTGERIALFRRTWRPEIIQPPITRFGPHTFPPQWSPQENDIQLVTLDATKEEYATIKTIFLGTMPTRCVLNIERVQNKKLYVRYAFQKALLMDKYSGNEQRVNEKMLFHGTKGTLPRKIWMSEDGFDLRFGRRGMWGIGTYFAENASYSDSYAHRIKEGGFKEMFLANVLIGNSIDMISNRATRLFTRPPVYLDATATIPEVLYDSVTGFSGGSRIYVLYKLDMAYPSYLVRYL